MGTPSSKRYLIEADLLDLDDDRYRHEIVAGVIVAEPFPTPRRLESNKTLDGGDVLPGLAIPVESIFER
jgi:hypothetical protein